MLHCRFICAKPSYLRRSVWNFDSGSKDFAWSPMFWDTQNTESIRKGPTKWFAMWWYFNLRDRLWWLHINPSAHMVLNYAGDPIMVAQVCTSWYPFNKHGEIKKRRNNSSSGNVRGLLAVGWKNPLQRIPVGRRQLGRWGRVERKRQIDL